MMKRGVLLIIGFGILVALIIVVIVAVVRSRQGPPEIITLKLWSPFDEGEVYQEMVKDYLEANPNLRFEFRYVEASDSKDYEAKVVNAIAAGTGPDIWLLRNDWLPKHQSKLAPAPASVKWPGQKGSKQQEALSQLLTEAVVRQNSRQGLLYGLPLAVDSLALFINTKVINEVKQEIDEQGGDTSVLDNYPTTWGGVEKWSRLITKKSGNKITRSGLSLGTVNNTYAPIDVFLALLSQKQGSLFLEDEKTVAIHLSKSGGDKTVFPGQDVLTFFTSFSDPSNPNYSWSNESGEPIRAFVEGRAAMTIGFSSITNSIRRLDKNFDNAVAVHLPQNQEIVLATDKPTNYAAYWTHAVSKTSPNSALAWQLLRLMFEPDNLRIYATKTGKTGVGLLKDITANLASGDIADSEFFASQLPDSPVIFKLEWQEVDRIVQDMISQKQESSQSVQAIIDSAAEQLKKLTNG